VNGTFKSYGPDAGYTATSPEGPYEYTSSNPGNDAEFDVVNEVNAYSGNKLGDFAHKYSKGKIPKGMVLRLPWSDSIRLQPLSQLYSQRLNFGYPHYQGASA
jgi:hypothetical protein